VASIRERSKKQNGRTVIVFHVQVRMRGFPSRTASFSSKREAERWAKTIEAEMIEGKHFRSSEARRRTLDAAIDRYMEEELPKKRDGRNHRYTLPYWKEQLGKLKLSEITPAIIVEHRGKLARGKYMRAKPDSKQSVVKDGKAKLFDRAPGTVNKYITCLSHVFTVARKEWHWISHNPFDGVSKLRENKGRVRYLSGDERERLFVQTLRDPILHTFVVVALSTAARAGELLRLSWRDVDLHEGRLLFRVTKNAEPRAAWLHGEALRLMKEHAERRIDGVDVVFPNPSHKGPYDYGKPFSAAVQAAGIVDFRFHDLRHSAATYLAMEGATEQQLRAIGGWKSGVVSKYVHIASQDAKDVLAKMNKKILGDSQS
jgi:integrase